MMKYIRFVVFLAFLAYTLPGCINPSTISNPMVSTSTSSPSVNLEATTPTAQISSSPQASIPSETVTFQPTPTLSADEWLSRQNPVVGLIWSKDGSTLAINAFSGFFVMDAQGNEIVDSLEESELLTPFAIDPQGRYFFAKDRVWDAFSGEMLYQLPLANTSAAAMSPDSKTLAVSDNTSITLWDVPTGKLQQMLSVGFGDGQQGLSFSPDGNSLLAVSADHRVKRIDLISGQYSQLFSLPEDSCCVTFSPDNALMLVRRPQHGEGSYQLWRVEQGTLIQDSGRCDSDVGLAAFSLDSQYFVIGPCGYDAQLWNASSPQWLHSFSSNISSDYAAEWRSAAFSPDGTKIALGNEVGEVLIWDLESYQLINTLMIPLSSLADE